MLEHIWIGYQIYGEMENTKLMTSNNEQRECDDE